MLHALSHAELRKLIRNRHLNQAVLPGGFSAAFALLLLAITGNRLVAINDEGLYLEGAVRILRGEVPYRDFFAVCGPGTFWLLAAIFRITGVSLLGARVLLALDLAVILAVIFWITSRFASRITAIWATCFFGLLALSSPNQIVVNHRWESSALALAAIAAAISGIQSPRRSSMLVAGICSALAAWVTPSMVLLIIAIAGWVCWDSRLRPTAPGYLAGVMLGSGIPASVLILHGGLIPMLKNLLWTGSHYSAANHIAYGAIFDSPARMLAAAPGIQKLPTALLLAATFLPAILPPAMILLWTLARRRPSRPEVFLLFCGLALVGTTYPRWDLSHLLYISPCFVIAAALWLEQAPPRPVRWSVFMLFAIPTFILCLYNLAGGEQQIVETPVGRVNVAASDLPSVRMCLERIQPGASVFVFPYQPILYFLTGARNPTRFDFLQPGMMSIEDEQASVAELTGRPPEIVLYRDVSPESYLRIWPSSDPSKLRMNVMEKFLRANYAVSASAENAAGELQLLARK